MVATGTLEGRIAATHATCSGEVCVQCASVPVVCSAGRTAQRRSRRSKSSCGLQRGKRIAWNNSRRAGSLILAHAGCDGGHRQQAETRLPEGLLITGLRLLCSLCSHRHVDAARSKSVFVYISIYLMSSTHQELKASADVAYAAMCAQYPDFFRK
jgi:hypothetical protein